MARKFVPPEINKPDSPAPLLVARDPGQQETIEGRPLVGPSGRLVFGGYDRLTGQHQQGALARAGLTRTDVNITNRVLKRPWNNEFYRHNWQDIKEGKRKLMELIDQLQPSIIVAMGSQAAYDLVPGWKTLTDRNLGDNSGGKSIKSAKGVMDRRGFLWYEHHLPADCPVLVTLHPASCLYQAMPNRVLLDIDMARMGAVLRDELPRQTFPDFKRIHTSADLEPIWESSLVSYDIETKWGGGEFLCIAFYTAEGQAFLAYEDALMACEDWLSSDRPKLAHNSQFDRYYLEAKCGIEVNGRHEDTICGHWACYPELAGKEDTGRETQKKSNKNEMTRKGLNFLASFHLNYPWWKSYTNSRQKMGRLCVNDVVATMDAWRIIEEDIADMQVRHQYERQLAKLPALIEVQKRGFRIDERMRQERLAQLRHRQKTAETKATEAAEEFLKTHSITHKEDGDEYWWYHDARCECCFGGSVAREHCSNCAGIEGSGANDAILKSDLLDWAESEGYEVEGRNKSELFDLLPPCEECGGVGTIPDWDFNVMSPTQMPALLWDHLDVPKYCYTGSPDATEETLKKVHEWSKGGLDKGLDHE